MKITVRAAGPADLETLVVLYRGLEQEMIALHSMWPLADGLDEPVEETMAMMLDSEWLVLIGELESVPFGFVASRLEPLLNQAGGEKVGVIRLIYVDPEAREVGIAEALRDTVLEEYRSLGIRKFDAHVLPGHRLAKNFFESGGFSARSIVMHHDDDRE